MSSYERRLTLSDEEIAAVRDEATANYIHMADKRGIDEKKINLIIEEMLRKEE